MHRVESKVSNVFVLVELYLLYAKLEEEYGLPRHAMNIYNRATAAVERHEMYSVGFQSVQ